MLRDNGTVNAILSNISPLFDGQITSLCWDALLQRETIVDRVHYDGDLSSEFSVSRTRKVNFLKTSKRNQRYVPPYIRAEEFQRLLVVMRRKNDLAGIILVRLMYGSGLRIGECLGLTIEDLITKESETGVEYALLIRNRPSDRRTQLAKNKPKVIDIRECHTKTYKQETDVIYLDEGTYRLIFNYLETQHEYHAYAHPEKYKESIASKIEESDFDNHYIFLNPKGGLLKIKEWNERLRQYFIESNIPVDVGTKQSGLNHRFRHGFAMFALKHWDEPPSLLQLKKLMRHTSLSSTVVYTRETIEEEIALKEEFIRALYNEIPELSYEFKTEKHNLR
jgi:integrase/recombinase XerD